jgi:hypothetical protein
MYKPFGSSSYNLINSQNDRIKSIDVYPIPEPIRLSDIFELQMLARDPFLSAHDVWKASHATCFSYEYESDSLKRKIENNYHSQKLSEEIRANNLRVEPAKNGNQFLKEE